MKQSMVCVGLVSMLGTMLAVAETMTIAENNYTNAAPLVLDGDLTIEGAGEGFVQTGPVSGSGDLRFNFPDKTAWLLASNTCTGDLYVDLGQLFVKDAGALGTSCVYVTEEGTRDKYKLLGIECLSGTMTVTNAFVLGTEDTANWYARLWVKGGGVYGSGGTVYLTGPITAHRSKVLSDWAAVTHLQGGVTGDKFVVQTGWDSEISIEEKPLELTEEFWVGGGGVVHLNVKGSTFPSLYGFNSTRLVCGDENVLPANANFATQDTEFSNVHVDLNGFDQEIGPFEGMNGGAKPFTFMNSKQGTSPTLTINQRVNSWSTNLFFEGKLNVVKKGRGVMPGAHALMGNLTVREGMFSVVGDVPGLLAETITIEAGATLDPGGRTVRCRKLVVRKGGVVNPGTVEFQESEIEGGAGVSAALVGPVTKSGTGTLYLMGGTVAGKTEPLAYDLPEGTVVYFPLDGSLEEACIDKSGHMAQLVLCTGNMPTYSANGRNGGCLYFNGNNALKTAQFPQAIPLGDSAYTVATWVKIDEGCDARGGWVGYGATNDGRCNNFRMNGSYGGIWNYWWARDAGCALPNGSTFDDRQWHYVVGTYNGAGERKIYFDGVCMVTSTVFRLDLAQGDFVIGKTLGDVCMKGWIDDVLVVDRVLSDDEIAVLYEQGGVKSGPKVMKPELHVEGGEVKIGNGSVVCCYHFDSVETLLEDASVNGITLVRGNGVSGGTFSEDSPLGDGGSLYLDGSSYLTTTIFPGKMPVANQARSIACFLKMAPGCGDEGAMVSWGSGTSGNYRYCNVALRSEGSKLALSPWGFDNHRVTVGYDNLVNRWHSFVVTWDGWRLAYYLDGNPVGDPQEYGFAFDTFAQDFRIGWAYYDRSYFKGNLDEVTIWNRAISPAEALAYHQRGIKMEETLTTGTRVKIQGDGVLDLGPGPRVTLDGLAGTGTVIGNVALADGAELSVADGGPLTIDGALTIAGGGTIVLPDSISEFPAVYPLFTPGSITGVENLAAWCVVNVPEKKKGSVRVRNGMLEVVVGENGLAVFVR